jgi:hypothetical protein
MIAFLRRRRRQAWVDPIGWDEKAQRVHDVTVEPGGWVLHHRGICWCSRREEDR